jgi:ferredoxin
MPILDPQKSAKQAKPRKKKPKDIAVINDACTGCAGSPVCIELCPVDYCMILVKDDVYAPDFGRVIVDPLACIGCKRCISKGPDGHVPRRVSLGRHRHGQNPGLRGGLRRIALLTRSAFRSPLEQRAAGFSPRGPKNCASALLGKPFANNVRQIFSPSR